MEGLLIKHGKKIVSKYHHYSKYRGINYSFTQFSAILDIMQLCNDFSENNYKG